MIFVPPTTTDKPIALPLAHARGVISTVLTGMNFDLLPGNNVYCYTGKESPTCISELLWGGGGGGGTSCLTN